MKKCFGCRQNLPLGSGRYHFFHNSDDELDTLTCTHNPINDQPYELGVIMQLKCECGTDKIGGGIHSCWCPKA